MVADALAAGVLAAAELAAALDAAVVDAAALVEAADALAAALDAADDEAALLEAAWPQPAMPRQAARAPAAISAIIFLLNMFPLSQLLFWFNTSLIVRSNDERHPDKCKWVLGSGPITHTALLADRRP